MLLLLSASLLVVHCSTALSGEKDELSDSPALIVPVEMVKRQSLIAFPRVGRSDGKNDEGSGSKPALWFGPRLGRGEKKSYDDYMKLGRSSGLIPFPRVGRADMRAGGPASTALWFGPRLGRESKRDHEYFLADGNNDMMYT